MFSSVAGGFKKEKMTLAKVQHPLWNFDREQGAHYPSVIGVDEVGRGCFAGPVVAAAAWLLPKFYKNQQIFAQTRAFNDSKQLKPQQRALFFAQIEDWISEGFLHIEYAVGSVEEIEQYNILGATRLCIERALNQLPVELLPNNGLGPLFGDVTAATDCPLVMVDGKPLKPFPWQHKAIVQGDGKSLAIAIASIYAKVVRDRMMEAFALTHPEYGFARHKGYGTAEHRAAILEHGSCALHRPSFLRKLGSVISLS